MYQSVDDLDELESEDARERAETRAAVWKLFIVAALILVLVALFAPSLRKADDRAPDPMRAERASYHMAISEGSIALRRARLKDFAATYPQSDRLPAVDAQLAVLDLYEARSWAKVMDASYDPELSRIDKLTAIQIYETQWSQAYLGGRESELTAVRQALEMQTELPDRSLKETPSSIPSNVPGNVMAGGPRPIVTPPPPRPMPVAPPTRPTVEATPYEPEVTRNITPRYPSRAQRRGIEALVVLSLSIDDRGRVAMTDVVSVEAERYGNDFVNAAERAARRTRYAPRMVNGEAKAVSGVIKRYRFQIAD